MRFFLEHSTSFVFILLLIGVWTSLPYAAKELHEDWTRLRGQFGIAFCLICIGLAGELGLDLAFFKIRSPNPDRYWVMVEPISLSLTFISVIGIIIAIRAMTFHKKGEWLWIRSVFIASLLSVLLASFSFLLRL